jgi:exopolysaccharide biosynthesis protein
MALKARDMVLKSGRVLSATLKNFINGNFINYKSDGTIDKTIGWLISEGIVFSDRYEHLKWVGNPKGTIIVFKNGKVEIGWKWDSEMARTKDDIWFCCQGFNLYPPDMTVSQGIAREGFQYASVGYTTDRLAMGYDGKNIVITARPESNAERAVLTMDNLGCKGNAICLDSGGSTNLVHDGKKHIVTDRTLASIIEW